MGKVLVLWRVNLISFKAASTEGSPRFTLVLGLSGAGGGGEQPSIQVMNDHRQN